LMYGHMDKQPPMDGWEEGLSAYTPVIRNGRLYGRGSADDGYALFASIAAVKALKAQGVGHGRVVIIIEADEESGSKHLPHYLTMLKPRIGVPSLIVCLDSGCGNYEQFFITTSLRGLCHGDLKVTVLDNGTHSGHTSGIIPSSFRVIRQLLNRIEDAETGNVLVPEFHCEIPEARIRESKLCAEVMGDDTWKEFPIPAGLQPWTRDLLELILCRTWRPTVSYTGIAGLPNVSCAGNVLRANTQLKISLRLPPRSDPQRALTALTHTLTRDPPQYAKVEFINSAAMGGWDAPPTAAWLDSSMTRASQAIFKKPYVCLGQGGSIPFMGMLGAMFPEAQFVITGVLGPSSNAHGPNEFIDILYTKHVTACVACILADHAVLPK